MFATQGSLLGWSGHNDLSSRADRPWKGQTTNGSHDEAALFKVLRLLVQEARDSVKLAGSFSTSLWQDTGREPKSAEELVREQEAIQEERMQGAQSYEDWVNAAKELDRLDSSEVWKTIEQSVDYDVDDLKARVAELESARDNDDLARMLRLIRHSLGRNVAGIGAPILFQRSRIGTKALIERYVDTAVETIESAMRLAKYCSRDVITPNQINQDMVNTRQSYGRTALLLSGGGTFGMMHIGVCKALFEADLLPRIISGTSAGSIVASVLGTRTDSEIPKLLAEFCDGDLRVFGKTPEDLSAWNMIQRFRSTRTVMDIKHLEDGMRPHLGDMTFLEAYNRTRRILTIALSHADHTGELPLLCCFNTTPHVLIRSAVAASCSVPFIYSSAALFQKDPTTGEITEYGNGSQRFIDGSVSHDLPLERLKEMMDVNHFIVSQVNPHITPFLPKEPTYHGSDAPVPEPTWYESTRNYAIKHIKEEFKFRYNQVQTGLSSSTTPIYQTAGKLMFHGLSILEQTYTGNITIFPSMDISDYLKILANPTPDFMRKAMHRGEIATWPMLERIRTRTAIERAIDASVAKTLERVVFSPSQVNLRLDRLAQPTAAARLRGRRHSTSARRSSAASMPLPSEQPDLLAALRRPPRSPHENSIFDDPLPDLANMSTTPPLSDSEDWAAPSLLTRFRSVPASPSLASKTFPFAPSGPPSPAAPSSLAMTPANTASPSAVEQRYKKLFHHGVSALPVVRPRSRNGSSSGATSPELMRESGGLEMPRTSRGGNGGQQQRSTSTGMKGLRPPGRQ